MIPVTVYWVHFFIPPIEGDHRTDFFFSSIAAIYTMFTPRQIGCGVSRLWAINLAENAYTSRYCIIRRETVIRKPHSNTEEAPAEKNEPETKPHKVELNHPDIIK